MNEPDRFYVYAYYEPGSDKPFYIGKGSGKRANDHLSPRCHSRRDQVPTPFYKKLRKLLRTGVTPKIKFLHEDLTEVDAFTRERELIEEIGRRDLGTGPLTNVTCGGEGTVGYWTADAREKQSLRKIGRKLPPGTGEKIAASNLGKKRTPESCKRIVAAKRAAYGRPVKSVDPRTGETRVYPAVAEVAKHGFTRENVTACCKGRLKTHKGLTWSYVEPQEPRRTGGNDLCPASCSSSPC